MLYTIKCILFAPAAGDPLPPSLPRTALLLSLIISAAAQLGEDAVAHQYSSLR